MELMCKVDKDKVAGYVIRTDGYRLEETLEVIITILINFSFCIAQCASHKKEKGLIDKKKVLHLDNFTSLFRNFDYKNCDHV